MAESSRWIPTLDDYADVAAFLLGTDPSTVLRLPRIDLAESALHAPFAEFGGVAAYPSVIDQAAVLLIHLAKNHPLPDGNKRAAFLIVARFLDANGRAWGNPDVEVDAGMVERVASGDAPRDDVVAWIRERTTPKQSPRPTGSVVQKSRPRPASQTSSARRNPGRQAPGN